MQQFQSGLLAFLAVCPNCGREFFQGDVNRPITNNAPIYRFFTAIPFIGALFNSQCWVCGHQYGR